MAVLSREDRRPPCGLVLLARASLLAVSFSVFFPWGLAAQGPTPPEITGFTPPGQTELVDLFTGDFRYTVPLFDVPGPHGGYPITLSYAGGITPEQEATWVGLGWTLNPGSIVRQMRGLPDDFLGSSDKLRTLQDIDPNIIFGLGLDANLELFGLDSSVGLGLNAGFKGYFNNYRGLGFTRTVGLSGQVSASGTSASVGLDLSNDSQEGLRASPSLGLSDAFSFSADIDAFRGLSKLSVSPQVKYLNMDLDLVNFLGYAKPTSIPATGRAMSGFNINLSFKFGGGVQGVFVNLKPYGFFNMEYLSNKDVTSDAYGFLHLHEAPPEAAASPQASSLVLDFNREKDGAIYDRSPNLAMPILTHDLFMASGRDVTGTFRAFRNDVPVVFDPRQESNLTGGALGVEIGPGTIVHVGVNGSINRTSTVVGPWDGGNSGAFLDAMSAGFTDDPSGVRERTYFKFMGEPSPAGAPVIGGGTAPLAAPLNASWGPGVVPEFYAAAGELRDPSGTAVALAQPADAARTPRATLVEAFTRDDLNARRAALPEFPQPQTDMYRKGHHIAGFRITTTEGVRYIYGIAVYNTSHEEHEFSVSQADRWPDAACTLVRPTVGGAPVPDAAYGHKVDASEKMLQVKIVPAYATAYLLTAVLGADYVDADEVPGPSDGDYGYWVRFTHVRDAGTFKWRTPYLGARFVRGPENGTFVVGSERRADKGFVTYGERESWYLDSIQTATHQAQFCSSGDTRLDAIGAGGTNPRAQITAPASGFMRPRRLDKVVLFPKGTNGTCSSGQPLVAAHLEYDQSLAPGAPNHVPSAPQNARGKLALRKVSFTHGTNTRAQLSPYEFDYEANDPTSNPPYRDGARDRWDVYRPTTSPATCPNAGQLQDPTLDIDTTYTTQTDPLLDRWSAAWTLRRIVEPSGRIVSVDFEADDYAYVQDRSAARMFPIVSASNGVTSATGGAVISPVRVQGGAPRPRVYFRLEAPVASATEMAERYLGPDRQLYFKLRVALKAGDKWQTVSGYANITGSGIATGPNGEPLGWVELAPVQNYHPFSVAAWQYLRLQQPELISENGINGDPTADPFLEALKVITMVDFVEDIIAMISGLYPKWEADGWGQQLDLAHSWIRLREPDGIKKGGGARVRRVQFSDAWADSTANAERNLDTGYVYSYRLRDGRSSGVAAYEPMSGGDENAVRRAKLFTDEVPLASSYNLFSENPIGEAHYPSAVVGYARVVRHSLAARAEIEASLASTPVPRPMSAGPVVHEFYTARDFPVRTDETIVDKRRNPQPHIIPIPFLGMITLNSLSGSQGYSVVLNDMHGKQKRITSYEYTPEWDAAGGDYKVREDPIEETEFIYRATGGYADGAADLSNAVTVLTRDATRATETLGEQSDFVVDVRSNRTEAWDAGINVNTDVIYAIFPIPIPVPIPNFGYSLSETKTVVTSRVTHRAGIIDRVRTREGSARFETRHTAYDVLTGRPLLTEAKNTFGDPVFDYSTPGRWEYPRMGAAYEEVGRSVELTGATVVDGRTVRVPSPGLPVCADDPQTQAAGCLPLGTELAAGSGALGVRLTISAAGSDGSTVLAADRTISAVPSGTARVTRSGDRNLLGTDVGSIRALTDPTSNRTPTTCTWTEKYACGECTILEAVPVPVCEVKPIFDSAGGNRAGSKQADCVASDVAWKRNRAAEGKTGFVELTREGKQCQVVLRDDKGQRVPLNSLKGYTAIALEDVPAGQRTDPQSGLGYTGLALRGPDGRLVLVYSNCGGFIGTVNRSRTEVAYCDRTETRTLTTLHDVLESTRATYTDYWPNADDDIRFAGSRDAIVQSRAAFDARDEFARGVRGIFRPLRHFVYVDDRRQSSEVNLRRDGTFDPILFEGDGLYPATCRVPWRWVTEFTRYSPASFETEERNAIGVPAASLYGLRGSVPIAVANNAVQDEIGFEGFEAFAAGAPVQVEQTGEGNITFYTREGTVPAPDLTVTNVTLRVEASEKYLVVKPRAALVARAGTDGYDGGEALVANAINRDGGSEVRSVTLPGIPCPVPVTGSPRGGPGSEPMLVLGDNIPFCPELDPATLRGLFRQWRTNPRREVDIAISVGTLSPTQRVPVVSISGTKAHTGKRSLRVAAESQFTQNELTLKPGRRYVVSAWVSRDATDVPSYRVSAPSAAVGVQVRVWAGSAELSADRPPPFEPEGPVIEGWQRIEGTFVVPKGATRISLAYLNGTTTPGTAAYFDDVRVLPEDGSLETFVYDVGSLRMTAKLDENNFATFYGHAPDGRVELIRRETVRGILTETDSRLHTRQRQ